MIALKKFHGIKTFNVIYVAFLLRKMMKIGRSNRLRGSKDRWSPHKREPTYNTAESYPKAMGLFKNYIEKKGLKVNFYIDITISISTSVHSSVRQ